MPPAQAENSVFVRPACPPYQGAVCPACHARPPKQRQCYEARHAFSWVIRKELYVQNWSGIEKVLNMGPKWARRVSNTGPSMGPIWTQRGPKVGPTWSKRGANMGPNMDPIWFQNGAHREPNMDPYGSVWAHLGPRAFWGAERPNPVGVPFF
jgi:hypothetical protein